MAFIQLTTDHPALRLPADPQLCARSVIEMLDTFKREEPLHLMRLLPVSHTEAEILIFIAEQTAKGVRVTHADIADHFDVKFANQRTKTNDMRKRLEGTGVELINHNSLKYEAAFSLNEEGQRLVRQAHGAFLGERQKIANSLRWHALDMRPSDLPPEQWKKAYSDLLIYLRGDPLTFSLAASLDFSPQEKITLCFFHRTLKDGHDLAFKDRLFLSLFPPHIKQPSSVINSTQAILNSLDIKLDVLPTGTFRRHVINVPVEVRRLFGFNPKPQDRPAIRPAARRPRADHKPG